MSITARTIIDPKSFALGFADSITQKGFDQSKIVTEAKQYLLSYLTAYYLVEDFTDIENQNFNSEEDVAKFKDLTFEQLIDRVQQLNKY